MAYKFQKGSAILSGALIQDSDITATGADALGQAISVDGNNLRAGDDIILNNGNLLVHSTLNHGMHIYAGNLRAEITASAVATHGEHVQMRIKNSLGNSVLKLGSAILESEKGQGFLEQHSSNGTRVALLSGSGNGNVGALTFQGAANIAGNLTVTGDLSVDGATVTLNSNVVKTTDAIAQIASAADSSATSVDSGFIVGTDTGADRIAQVILKAGTFDSDVSEDVFFGLFGDTVATNDYVNLKATKFYGDASRVTGLSGAPSFSVHPKSNGQTLVEGLNYVTGAGSAQTLNLPAASGLDAGTVIKVKSYGNHSSTNKITIDAAGADTIDGQGTIDLENPFSAVTLIRTAANGFSII